MHSIKIAYKEKKRGRYNNRGAGGRNQNNFLRNSEHALNRRNQNDSTDDDNDSSSSDDESRNLGRANRRWNILIIIIKD